MISSNTEASPENNEAHIDDEYYLLPTLWDLFMDQAGSQTWPIPWSTAKYAIGKLELIYILIIYLDQVVILGQSVLIVHNRK